MLNVLGFAVAMIGYWLIEAPMVESNLWGATLLILGTAMWLEK